MSQGGPLGGAAVVAAEMSTSPVSPRFPTSCSLSRWSIAKKRGSPGSAIASRSFISLGLIPGETVARFGAGLLAFDFGAALVF